VLLILATEIMEALPITVLHSIPTPRGRVFEVKFNDVPDTASKADRYQWYMIHDNRRHNLKFTGMLDDTRYLECEEFIVKVDLAKGSVEVHSRVAHHIV